MTAKQILQKYLKEKGFDGLQGGCDPGCSIDEVMACGEFCGNCWPGYFVPKSHPTFDSEYPYMISAEKLK